MYFCLDRPEANLQRKQCYKLCAKAIPSDVRVEKLQRLSLNQEDLHRLTRQLKKRMAILQLRCTLRYEDAVKVE